MWEGEEGTEASGNILRVPTPMFLTRIHDRVYSKGDRPVVQITGRKKKLILEFSCMDLHRHSYLCSHEHYFRTFSYIVRTIQETLYKCATLPHIGSN
jgi:hypothetical protein